MMKTAAMSPNVTPEKKMQGLDVNDDAVFDEINEDEMDAEL